MCSEPNNPTAITVCQESRLGASITVFHIISLHNLPPKNTDNACFFLHLQICLTNLYWRSEEIVQRMFLLVALITLGTLLVGTAERFKMPGFLVSDWQRQFNSHWIKLFFPHRVTSVPVSLMFYKTFILSCNNFHWHHPCELYLTLEQKPTATHSSSVLSSVGSLRHTHEHLVASAHIMLDIIYSKYSL